MYNSETSVLMAQVSAITSSQFVQSVQDRIIVDILWQVGAALISLLWSIATRSGVWGYLAMYMSISLLMQMAQERDTIQLINSQTLYNEGYEGAITLSSKDVATEIWGGTISDLIFGSSGGVYTDVILEYDKHKFNGVLLLAPEGWKKTHWGVNYPISLPYGSQTRDYSGYSDTDDSRLSVHSTFIPHAPTAIMGLEKAIARETGGKYNKLYPYLQYNDGIFVPTFQFAGEETKFPIPEFYHEYPIFVDSDSYSVVENQQFTIYKVFDSESSQDIELIPEDQIHMIYADIQQIDVYQYEKLGVDSGGYDIYDRRFVGTYLDNTYSFNKTRGVLTFNDHVYSYLISNAQIKENAYSDNPDYDIFYVFEIKVAKYQALDPTNLGENHVATMQAIEQNILEYTYQYKHAQVTQTTLSQMCYTVLVTSVSTIITIGVTYGISKIANALGATSTSGPIIFRDLFGEQFVAQAGKWGPTTLELLAGLGSKTSIITFLISPISESLQEIFLDPWLEIVVSEFAASIGLSRFAQMILTSLVEGGREAAMGSMSQFLFGNTQTNTQGFITHHQETRIYSEQTSALETINERESHIKISHKWSSIIKTGASLVLGAALVGISGPAFFSAALVSGFSAIKSFTKSFKIHKTIIHNIIVNDLQEHVDNVNNEIIDDLITSEDKIGPIAEGIEIAREAGVSMVTKSNRPVATQDMVQKIKKLMPYGFNGFYDSGLGALRFFIELGYDISEILVYGGGMSGEPHETYIIKRKDTVDAILLKNLFNTIHSYEPTIAKSVRDESGYKFASDDSSDPINYYRFERGPDGKISSDNLRELIHVGERFADKYIKTLDQIGSDLWIEDKKGFGYYKSGILRLRLALSKKFTSLFDSVFKSHFDSYVNEMTRNVQFLYNYLFLCADHMKVDISVRSVSNLLGRDNRYLTRLIIPGTTKSYEAFFGLIVETLTIADTKDIFKSMSDFVSFKKEFIDLVYEYGKDVVFKNDFIPKEQFEFLAHSLYAYNKLGKKEKVNPNNPGGLYLLSHLSRDFSDSGNSQLFRQQLYQGKPTLQVFEIIHDLKKNRPTSRDFVIENAIKTGEKYQEIIYTEKASRISALGVLAHKPIQVLIYRFLESKGILGLGLDTKVLMGRDYNPDQSMRFTGELQKVIDLELLKKIIERNIGQTSSVLTANDIMDSIRHIVLDYTLSSDKVVTVGTTERPGKVRKHYQSPSTLFFIINYNLGLYDASRQDKYIKGRMVKEYINDPEMVSFIDTDEFIQLFKIEDNAQGKFLTNFNNLLKLIDSSKRSRAAFNRLRRIYNSATVDYHKLRIDGRVGSYIGDLD